MKTVKLFYLKDMPDNVKEEFLNQYQRINGTDVIEHYLYGENEYCTISEFKELNIDESEIVFKEIEGDEVFYNLLGKDIVSDWLIDNGAKLEYDKVYIKL